MIRAAAVARPAPCVELNGRARLVCEKGGAEGKDGGEQGGLMAVYVVAGELSPCRSEKKGLF